MEAVVSSLLGIFGGGAGLVAFGVLLVVVLGALFLSGRLGGDSGVTEKIFNLASYAVMAVNKLSDNGDYDGMSRTERHTAKKLKALEIIESGLKAEGIKPNNLLMNFASFAIESVLNRIDSEDKVETELQE